MEVRKCHVKRAQKTYIPERVSNDMTKKSVKITIDSKLLEWVDDQVIGTVITNRSQAI